VISFNDSTDDTLLIAKGSVAALRRACRPGYDYKKADVQLAQIAPDDGNTIGKTASGGEFVDADSAVAISNDRCSCED